MAASRPLTITDWLADVPDDTEEAPWVVMPDYQLWAISLLLSILRRHRRAQGLRWYIGSELWVALGRPGRADLLVAPDLFVAEADPHSRTSWDIHEEGQPPRFVLEIVTEASWRRDTVEKVRVYDLMGVEEYAIFAPFRQDGGPALFGYHRGPFGPWQPWQPVAGGLGGVALGGLTLEVSADNPEFLRPRDAGGRLLPSEEEGEELAVRRLRETSQRLGEASRRIEEERRRADDAEARVAELEAAVAALRKRDSTE